MEDGAANADHRHREQDQQIGIGESQQHQADQREGHARGQDEIHRPLVQPHPDQRLKEGSGKLENESNEADLEEAQREPLMEDRIKRRRERLHHVVEHMRGAERDQHAKRRCLHPPTASRGGISVCRRSRQGFVPGPRVLICAVPKNQAAKSGLMSGMRHLWALRPLIVNSETVFPIVNVQKAVTRVYFGASTMVIWRPSINGSASTLAIGAVSTLTRCKSL